MNNSNMEFTMDDASYKNEMSGYSDGQGGYTLNGLQSELPTRFNTATFNPLHLGEYHKLYAEYGDEVYNTMANEENKKIRKRNEAIIARDKALRSSASAEEIAALNYVTEDGGWRDKVTDELIKGNQQVKDQLKNLYEVNAEKQRKQASGAIALSNGYTLDMLENFVAMYDKRTEKSRSAQDALAFAQQVAQQTGVNFQYDQNTNSFFVIDNNGATHEVRPGIGDHLGAWAFDALGSVGAAAAAYKWAVPVLQLGLRATGRAALGAAGVTAAPSAGTTLLIGGAIFAVTEGTAALLPTAFDAIADGGVSAVVSTIPSRLMGEDRYVQDFMKLSMTIGYPDATKNIIQEGVLGAGGAVAIKGGVTVTKGLYHGTKGTASLVSRVRNGVRPSVDGLHKSWGRRLADRTETFFKDRDVLDREIAMNSLKSQIAKMEGIAANDAKLTQDYALAQARALLGRQGITEIVVDGSPKALKDLDDHEVAMLMLQTNEEMASTLVNRLNETETSRVRLEFRENLKRTVTSVNNEVVKVAQNGMETATAQNFITKLKKYKSTIKDRVTKEIDTFSKHFDSGVRVSVEGNLARGLHKVFNYNSKGGTIESFFAGKQSADTLGKDSTIFMNLRESMFGKQTIEELEGIPTPIVTPPKFDMSVKDLLRTRFELRANADIIANRLGDNGEKQVDQLIKDIDDYIEEAIKNNIKGPNAASVRTAKTQLDGIFDTSVNDMRKYSAVNSKFKVTGTPTKAGINTEVVDSTTLGKFTEDLLKNADNDLPDIQHFAKMLAGDGVKASTIAKQLETNLVNHIITKNLTSESGAKIVDADKVLKWLGQNKHSFTTREGRIAAEWAESSLTLLSNVKNMVSNISQDALKNDAPNAALSTKAWHSLMVFLNKTFLGRTTRLLGHIVKTDYAQQKHLSDTFNKFIVNPVNIDAINGMKHALAAEAKRGKLSDDEVAELAKSMGEMSSLYNSIKTDPQSVVRIMQQMADQVQ